MSERLTLVKKILADGSPCRKCGEVIERLEASGGMKRINRIVVADERDPNSEGMRIAARLGVKQAPFFIVERDGSETVYESFMRFQRDILDKPVTAAEEAREILERNPDLDFL